MSAELLIANTLRVAREDLGGARLLAAHGNRNAIYLCEQAAEKVIRAVLTSEGIHAGIGHRLDEMVGRVPDANPLKLLLREVEELAAYATTYRYPTPSGRVPSPPAPDEFQALANKVEAALRDTAARLGVDLDRAGQPASRPGPVR